MIQKSMDDDGAIDAVTIALSGKSSEADHMVIASGRSSRHVGAIAEKLIDRLKEENGTSPRAEGVETGDWILIDAGDVIVHIFRPEVREFYQLEKIWMTAPDATARAASLS
ncbi:MAG: ribosome silencing factor [Pseudomonadota bacterium]